MTSTNTFQGMERDTKPSSRVLAPPGGGSSNIFGVDTPAPAKQPPKPKPVEKQENILGQPQQNQSGRNIRAAPKQEFNPITGEPYPPKTPKADSKAAGDNETQDADGSKDQTVTTKEEQTSGNSNQSSKPAPANEPKEHTSTRVLNPPGGRSTKLW